MRKPRSDSRLNVLNFAQRAKLLGWLRQNLKYVRVVELLRSECGIKTSAASVGTFFSRNMEAILRGPRPEQVSGVCVVVTCHRPGEIKFAVAGLLPGEDYRHDGEQPATVRAEAVEITAHCKKEGEIRLVVLPVADVATGQPEDSQP